MNLAFLGDALDHWKGSLFGSLQDAGVLQEFAVDPMASDSSDWTEEDIGLFARLLHVRQSQVIFHGVGLKDRKAYFEEIRHRGDLFVDPDTGVATGQVREPVRYIMPEEVGHLIDANTGRLVVVYQHVRAQQVAERVDTVLAAIGSEAGTFSWSSYESGTVAMLFISRSESRTAGVAGHFRNLLRRHAMGRIREGVNIAV